MALSDKLVGLVLMVAGITIWVYYTLWTIVLPFLPSDHIIQQYFPDRSLALAIPGVAGVLLLTAIGMFVAKVMADNAAKKAKKKTT